MEAHARLLGTPQLRFAHASFEPPLTKATALLYYLAFKGEWCSRDELLYLFYPDAAEKAARSSLRQLLTSIRRLPYSHGLIIETGRLRWPISTDVQAFRRAVQAEHPTKATELYRGRLLEGCTLNDPPEFDSWLELQREELHSQWRNVVLNHAESRDPERATYLLQTVLKHDPLDEEALQVYMRVSARAGQTGAALSAYRSFSQTLRAELDLEPAWATQKLVAVLEGGDDTSNGGAGVPVPVPEPGAAPADGPVPPTLQSANPAFPGVATSFVGRVHELKAVARLLDQRDCRLLTILAAGGTGKTRLALEALRAQQEHYPDGCYFAALDSLSTSEAVPAAVATALGLELKGQSEPISQVIRAIGHRRILLVLDNCEHVLGATTLCSELLQRCPELKLLVTSRERLHLAEEWLLPLEGLNVPTDTASSEEVLAADAVVLFIQRARQVRPEFSPTTEDIEAIAGLCRLTQGSPLAIELAAVWVRVMSCVEIVEEIEKSIDFLRSSTRNVRERHKSLRATFEHSWRLLSEEEQDALRTLSVFVGGFTRGAASVVTGVPNAVLAALVDKSLLRVASGGRYDRHPLLYQFTEEKLTEHPEERVELRRRHGLYYLRLVRERYGDLLTHKRQATLAMLAEEHPNISAAWRWAVMSARVDDIKAATWAIDSVYSHRAPEGRALLAEAIAGLDEDNPKHQSALGHLLIQQGHFLFMLNGADAEHDASIERGLELLRRRGEAPGLMRGLVGLGVSKVMKGDLAAARALYLEGLALARVHGTPRDISIYLGNLMAVERELSDATRFRALCETALAELKSLDSTVEYARLTFKLGVYLLQDNMEPEGEELVRDGLRLIRELGDPALEPCGYLALRACALGNQDEGEALAQRGLVLAREFGDKLDEVHALSIIGRVAIARGDYDEARNRLRESLQLASTAKDTFGLIDALIAFAELHAALGRGEEATAWLGLVRYQPTVLKSHAHEAERLLEELRKHMQDEVLEAALERGQSRVLVEVIAEMLRPNAY